MKRTMIVMFALALLLAWGGSAMAQQTESALSKAAFKNCLDAAGDEYFADADAALRNQVLVYPYFVSDTDFWSGMAIINKTAVADGLNIAAKRLCVAVVGDDGTTAATWVNQNIYAGTMYVSLVDALGDDDVWSGRLALGVFAKNADNNLRNSLEGFGMIGNGTEGQGYFAYSQTGANALGAANGDDIAKFIGIAEGQLNYLPQGDGDWWRGVAMFNNHPDDDAWVIMNVVHQDGSGATNAGENLEIESGKMAAGTLDNLVDGVKASERARVGFCQTDDEEDDDCTADAVGANEAGLLGFTMFGNTKEAMGYLPLAQ